jgi:hypothetical protein
MNIKKNYIGILLAVATLLPSACTSDDFETQPAVIPGNDTEAVTPDDEPEEAGRVVQLKAYSSLFADKGVFALPAPAGFNEYTPDKATTMGIYTLLSENLPEDWTSPKEERIVYTNKWHAHFDVLPDKDYTVYGYMPKTGDMGSSLTKTTANEATLTITDIKPVTTDDICIITGVKNTDEGLKEGQFYWTWPITAGEDSYKIHILMDHLYAAAKFRLKIDEEYAALRTIKLKTMTLSTNIGSVKAVISLTHNDTGASPVSSVEYTASGSNDAIVIFNNDEGIALDKTTPLDINACFAPTLSDNLTLVSTYDVYDRKGNLIRQNRTATNKLPNLEAIRGQRVQLDLTVNPTYLYVLSDPDLDNPTVKVEN